MSDSQNLRALSDEYEKLQGDLSETVQARQKLESQYTENQGVQKEFAGLEDDAKIYKLVGPVLLKQDTVEAKSTVDSRLQYIDGEIKRVEVNINALQKLCSEKRDQIMRIQSQQQQQQAPPA
ncbi:Prefoldin [Neohortaea acidophila]|uniref:Prefoldin n=1 Tax=Neohortaea acidophila TaxID=245834 RepID=A0A6A6PNR4_9PEZI|nr:Prefoldin [Neohortaea acidophila]KAF2481545.1 Prefoldin [Neohortaea acidophila]